MVHFFLRYLLVALSTHIILGERIKRVSSSSSSSLQAEVAESTTRLKCNNWCITCKNSSKKIFVRRSQGYYAHALGAGAFLFTPLGFSASVVPLASAINSMHNGCNHVEFRFGSELKEVVNYPFMLTHSSDKKQQEYAQKCARISDPTYEGLKAKETEEITSETTTSEPGEENLGWGAKIKKNFAWAGKKVIKKMTKHEEHSDVYECFKHDWLCGEEGSEDVEVLRLYGERRCSGWTGLTNEVSRPLKYITEKAKKAFKKTTTTPEPEASPEGEDQPGRQGEGGDQPEHPTTPEPISLGEEEEEEDGEEEEEDEGEEEEEEASPGGEDQPGRQGEGGDQPEHSTTPKPISLGEEAGPEGEDQPGRQGEGGDQPGRPGDV